MNPSQPLVSVLMTVYNREHFIREAIESVLASTFTNFELIITDDGSTDQSVSVAREYEAKDKRIRVYQNEKNLGDYVNRNRAAFYAKGKYLKYLDSDDLIYPNGLEMMVSGMEEFPEAALGVVSNRNSNQHYPVLFQPIQAYRKYYFSNELLSTGPTGTIIKREVFESLKGFSGKQYIGDTELWLRIAQQHPVISLPPGLIYWREHEGQQMAEEKKNNQIEAIRFDLDKSILNSPDCPLDANERKMIIRNLKNIKCRNLLMGLVKGKICSSFHKCSLLQLTVKDFLSSIFPNQLPVIK
jgi:glycosyltransferase involved in cell wall biosynthesis